jgi:ATP-dependent metalloprotease
MAKALAGESNCAFFYKSGAEFEEVYVGVGARRIRDVFKAAKKHAPSIIFIDEIDSIAGRRSANGMNESRETINQLLAEMDGFRKNDSVIVVAATNLEQSLDPAVKRSGRFDKVVHVPLPDIKGRENILTHFAKKIQIHDVDLNVQARRTIGFSGADLKNFINTAILHGVRMDRDHANIEDFDFAYDRIKMGIRRAGLLADEEEKRATAIHEIGHAMICALTEGALPLYKVTIMPSGQSLGHVNKLFSVSP